MDEALPLPAPLISFEERAAPPTSPQADFVISPLLLALLFAWEEDEDYC
jgi:hypothetical protein